jgi:hypothetical protein
MSTASLASPTLADPEANVASARRRFFLVKPTSLQRFGVVLSMVVVGCSGGGGGSSSSPQLTGEWGGTFGSTASAGTVRMSFRQTGSSVTGSAAIDDTQNAVSRAFTIDGSVVGAHAMLTLTETSPCAASIPAGADLSASGQALAVDFAGDDCVGPFAVTTTLDRLSDVPRSLEVFALDVAGATGVPRDHPLTLTFNDEIDPQSVSEDGLRVSAAGNFFPGRAVVSGRIVTFYPTVIAGDRNDFEPPNDPLANALGFPAYARVQVDLLANSALSIRSTLGTPLGAPYEARLTVGAGFDAEPSPVPPQLAGAPRLSPTPIVPGDVFADPNFPGLLPLVDPSTAEVSVTFSEPMNPGTFDPLTTFVVSKPLDLNPPAGDPNACVDVGLGSPILGTIDASPDATTFTFRPLGGFRDRPCTSQPYVVRVELLPTLTDLAGTPLGQPIVFHFATADQPAAPDYTIVTEDFTTLVNRGSPNDFYHPNTARWIGNGFLEGTAVTRRTVNVVDVESAFNLPQPLTPEGSRLQQLYFRDDFSNPQTGTGPGLESFVSMSWGPRSNAVFAGVYPQIALRLGHSQATSSTGLRSLAFAANYDGFPENPTTVYSGRYEVPSRLDAMWMPWPEFTRDFEYSGVSSVVLEADVAPGSTGTQLFRNTSTGAAPLRRIFDAFGAGVATCGGGGCNENTVYHQQFVLVTKKSFGVSRYIDSRATNPDYTGPVVRYDAARGGPGTDSHGGPGFFVTWEGADAAPGGQVDPYTATGFSPSIDVADGHRFIRFEIVINGDPFGDVVPIIDSVSFAFRTL